MHTHTHTHTHAHAPGNTFPVGFTPTDPNDQRQGYLSCSTSNDQLGKNASLVHSYTCISPRPPYTLTISIHTHKHTCTHTHTHTHMQVRLGTRSLWVSRPQTPTAKGKGTSRARVTTSSARTPPLITRTHACRDALSPISLGTVSKHRWSLLHGMMRARVGSLLGIWRQGQTALSNVCGVWRIYLLFMPIPTLAPFFSSVPFPPFLGPLSDRKHACRDAPGYSKLFCRMYVVVVRLWWRTRFVMIWYQSSQPSSFL